MYVLLLFLCSSHTHFVTGNSHPYSVSGSNSEKKKRKLLLYGGMVGFNFMDVGYMTAPLVCLNSFPFKEEE